MQHVVSQPEVIERILPWLDEKPVMHMHAIAALRRTPPAPFAAVFGDDRHPLALLIGPPHRRRLFGASATAALALLRAAGLEGLDVRMPIELAGDLEPVLLVERRWETILHVLDHLVYRPPARASLTRVVALTADEARAWARDPGMRERLDLVGAEQWEGSWRGVIDDGELVSVAGVITRTLMAEEIGAVYTAAQARGRGLARLVTAALTEDILGRLRTPVYRTLVENDASIRVCAALGYEPLYRTIGLVITGARAT